MGSSAALLEPSGRHPDVTIDEAGALFRALCQLPVQRLDEEAAFWFEMVKIDPRCFNSALTLRLIGDALRLRESSGEAD